MKIHRAKLLDQLYGEQESMQVYQLLNDLDPLLNECVQTIAYDYFWELKGLSIRDKSLVTFVTLVVLGKEPQTRPHMIGFLNTGGTIDEVVEILFYVSKKFNIHSACFQTFISILKKMGKAPLYIVELKNYFSKKMEDQSKSIKFKLTRRDQKIIDVSASVALCQPKIIKKSMNSFLKEENCSETDLRRLLIHQIVYCGFPTVINAFSVLKELLES